MDLIDCKLVLPFIIKVVAMSRKNVKTTTMGAGLFDISEKNLHLVVSFEAEGSCNSFFMLS